MWLDSDILVTRPLPRILPEAPAGTLVAAEEPRPLKPRNEPHRAIAWGLEIARRLPATVNTGILRVTPSHLELLRQWSAMLDDPMYRAAQRLAWRERPTHLLGDQDALEALLCSPRGVDVPVELLRRGSVIAQCKGPSGPSR